jgi:hypothetical protein
MHRLPAAVEIELALEVVPRSLGDEVKAAAASRTLVYQRIIPLVDHSDLIIRAHAVPPTFAAAGGTSGGSNLGGGANPGGPDSKPPDGSNPGGPATNPFGDPPPGGTSPEDFAKLLEDLLKGSGG